MSPIVLRHEESLYPISPGLGDDVVTLIEPEGESILGATINVQYLLGDWPALLGNSTSQYYAHRNRQRDESLHRG